MKPRATPAWPWSHLPRTERGQWAPCGCARRADNVGPRETFGFRYRDNATALPYDQLPASVRACGQCYNATTRQKW